MEIRDYSQIMRPHPVRVGWKVPVAFNNDWVGLRLLQICKELGCDRPMDVAYGAPMCAWAGGRPSAIRQTLTEGQLHAYFSAYAEYGVKVALTMSRLEIAQDTLADAYCNTILKVASEYNSQVILVDDKLVSYIREKYPQLALIASLNKCMCELREDYSEELDYYKRLFEQFDEVVIRCEAALNDEMICALGEYTKRCEVITNQACMRDCQYCHIHIASQEEVNSPDVDPRTHKTVSCFYQKDIEDLPTWLQNNLLIGQARVDWLAEHGITKMKLAGRNAPLLNLLDRFGQHVFEPTGIFPGIKKSIMVEWRSLTEHYGGMVAPFTLPVYPQ